VRFTENEAKDEAHAAIGRFLDAAIDGRVAGLVAPRREEHFTHEFLAPGLTARQAGLFHAACAHRD